jgi:hypothetical protein
MRTNRITDITAFGAARRAGVAVRADIGAEARQT